MEPEYFFRIPRRMSVFVKGHGVERKILLSLPPLYLMPAKAQVVLGLWLDGTGAPGTPLLFFFSFPSR